MDRRRVYKANFTRPVHRQLFLRLAVQRSFDSCDGALRPSTIGGVAFTIRRADSCTCSGSHLHCGQKKAQSRHRRGFENKRFAIVQRDIETGLIPHGASQSCFPTWSNPIGIGLLPITRATVPSKPSSSTSFSFRSTTRSLHTLPASNGLLAGGASNQAVPMKCELSMGPAPRRSYRSRSAAHQSRGYGRTCPA